MYHLSVLFTNIYLTSTYAKFFKVWLQPNSWVQLAAFMLHAQSLHAQLVMSNSVHPCGLQSARFLCPWDSPGKNTRVGCHALLQAIFSTQVQNLCLLNLCIVGRCITAEPSGKPHWLLIAILTPTSGLLIVSKAHPLLSSVWNAPPLLNKR